MSENPCRIGLTKGNPRFLKSMAVWPLDMHSQVRTCSICHFTVHRGCDITYWQRYIIVWTEKNPMEFSVLGWEKFLVICSSYFDLLQLTWEANQLFEFSRFARLNSASADAKQKVNKLPSVSPWLSKSKELNIQFYLLFIFICVNKWPHIIFNLNKTQASIASRRPSITTDFGRIYRDR